MNPNTYQLYVNNEWLLNYKNIKPRLITLNKLIQLGIDNKQLIDKILLYYHNIDIVVDVLPYYKNNEWLFKFINKTPNKYLLTFLNTINDDIDRQLLDTILLNYMKYEIYDVFEYYKNNEWLCKFINKKPNKITLQFLITIKDHDIELLNNILKIYDINTISTVFLLYYEHNWLIEYINNKPNEYTLNFLDDHPHSIDKELFDILLEDYDINIIPDVFELYDNNEWLLQFIKKQPDDIVLEFLNSICAYYDRELLKIILLYYNINDINKVFRFYKNNEWLLLFINKKPDDKILEFLNNIYDYFDRQLLKLILLHYNINDINKVFRFYKNNQWLLNFINEKPSYIILENYNFEQFRVDRVLLDNILLNYQQYEIEEEWIFTFIQNEYNKNPSNNIYILLDNIICPKYKQLLRKLLLDYDNNGFKITNECIIKSSDIIQI